MQFPETATLIESQRPNAQGKMVIEVHAMGCRHTNIARARRDQGHGIAVVDVADPASMWVQAGDTGPVAGVAGAVSYMLAVASGLMDDGEDNGAWIARLAPCAKP